MSCIIAWRAHIEVIDDAVTRVQALRGVTFDRTDKDVEMRQAGVIAQEVEKVLPEVVNEDADGYKTVAYGNMVGLLIEAIKEQQEQIQALTEEVEEFKNRG